MPMLEIDGLKLTQTRAIINFLGQKYKMQPEDPMVRYKGEKAVQYIEEDVVLKMIVRGFFMLPEDEKLEALEKLYSTSLPKAFNLITDLCLGDTKFICGDELTQYDFEVAGFFTTWFFHEKPRLEGINEVYHDNAPEKLKTYVSNFREEMKDYLVKREETYPNVTY